MTDNNPHGRMQTTVFDRNGTTETGVSLPNMPMAPHYDQSGRAYDPTRANNPGRKGGMTSIDPPLVATRKVYDVSGNVIVVTPLLVGGADAIFTFIFDDNESAKLSISFGNGAGTGGAAYTKTIRVPTFGKFEVIYDGGASTVRLSVMNDPNDGFLGVF